MTISIQTQLTIDCDNLLAPACEVRAHVHVLLTGVETLDNLYNQMEASLDADGWETEEDAGNYTHACPACQSWNDRDDDNAIGACNL